MLAGLGASAFTVFLATVPAGWAQGLERFALYALIVVSEVVVKIVAGTLLVIAGFGATGALWGACIGAAGALVIGLCAMRRDLTRPARLATGRAYLLRGTASMIAVQALVTMLAVADVVMAVAIIATPEQAGAYSLAATLGRTPLFVGVALSLAVLPALSRHADDARIVTENATMLARLVLPLLVVLTTAPTVVIAAVLPAEYADATTYLPLTAVSGTALAFVTLQIGWLRAVGAFAPALRTLAVGLVGVVAVLIAGGHWPARSGSRSAPRSARFS